MGSLGSNPGVSAKFGGLTHPAVSLVLKTSGARDGMGIDTSALRHICRERAPPSTYLFNIWVGRIAAIASGCKPDT